MKKINFVIIALLFLSFTTQAQFGVKLGANFSAVGSYGNTEDGESASLKPGIQLGAFYKAAMNDKISLLVELNFEKRGTISKKNYTVNLPVQDPASGAILGVGDYTIDQEANSSQSYINIPVLLAFGGERLKFYVGPNVGFMFSGKADFERTIGINLNGNPLPSPPALNLEDVDWFDFDSFKQIFTTVPPEDGNFLNSLDLGLNIGAMFNLTDQLFIDARINQGILDTSNNSYDFSIYPNESFSFPSRDDTDRNLSVQISLGFTF